MEARFSELNTHPLFQNINILDCSRWPTDDADLSVFGENEIQKLIEHYIDLLQNNGCDVGKILNEWNLLKLDVSSITSGMRTVKYLEVWARIFTSADRQSYKNVLHLIELLLITPTTNTKLEIMFSRIWRNRLSRERLDHNLRIGEEGLSVNQFDPESCINRWFNEKVWRIAAAKPHSYAEKRKKVGESSQSVNVVQYCIFDFESDSDDE